MIILQQYQIIVASKGRRDVLGCDGRHRKNILPQIIELLDRKISYQQQNDNIFLTKLLICKNDLTISQEWPAGAMLLSSKIKLMAIEQSYIQLMTSEAPRAPTPAVFRVSPLYDIYGQTLYPYVNHKLSGITPYLSAFKKAIAPINPFAAQQVPTTDSAAVDAKFGERWWKPDPYPSRIIQDNVFPGHYDPLADPRYKKPEGSNVIHVNPAFRLEYYPKHCTRTVDAYKTCLLANDEDKNKCQHEGEDILAICPSWALDKMKENQRLKLKLEAQGNLKYRKAMEVPDYNQGRTVADVPLRNWSDGERAKLRPNSIWADDRYADITQKEVDEAKERVKKRNLSRGHQANTSVHIEAYDRRYEAPSTQTPLYP